MTSAPSHPWYHGSPLELTTLRHGSTITQNRDLARIFSHKPTLVCVFDDGQIKHNGTANGYLYTVAEEIEPGDVTPHPYTTMAAGDEWLTTREMRLQLIVLIALVPEEQLTDGDIADLKKRALQ